MRIHSGRPAARRTACLAASLTAVCLCLSAFAGQRASAQSARSVPIVYISEGTEPIEGTTNALLIGAAAGTKWIPDKKVHASLKSGQTYRFFSATGYVAQAAAGKTILSEASGEAWYLPFRKLKAGSGPLIGIAGAWNPLPRPVKTENVTNQTYLNVVADVLKQRGLAGAKPHISKILRVDLEGKGQESVLIEATSPDLYKEPFAETTLKSGAYCFILARTLVNGKVKTIVLDGDYSGNKTGSAGSNVVRLSHVLDLNGSGVMEIVVSWSYYEGGGVKVFRLKDGKAQMVLSAADGA